MHERTSLLYRSRMQFPDSTFAALRLAADADAETAGRSRLLWLALVLTVAAVSAGWIAGG